MIYKNDQPYQLTDADRTKVHKFLGWETEKGNLKGKKPRPAVITYTDSMFTFNKANNRKVKPSQVNLPLEAILYEDGIGSVKWNYTKTVPVKDKDRGLIYQKYYTMTGAFTVPYDQIDFLFFLICKSTLRQITEAEEIDGKTQTGVAMFRIENKEADAKAKLEKQRKQYEIQGYINGPVGVRWETAKVRRHAIVFGIENADEMEDNELRSVLLGRLQGEPNAWESFYKTCDTHVETNNRYLIEMCKKNQSIIYDDKARKWFWFDNGNKGAEICAMSSSFSKPEEALLRTMELDETVRISIQNCVTATVE